MADLASDSANTVSQPAGSIKGNAPPTPPETQELKGAEPTSKLPATNSDPAEPIQAPRDVPSATVPEPAEDSAETGANGTADIPQTHKKLNAPEADIGHPNEPLQPIDSTLQTTEEKVDQGAVQPEKPSEGLPEATPLNAVSSTAKSPGVVEEPEQSAKPVSVDEIQDPEGPTAKTGVVNGVAKPETAAEAATSPTAKATKDLGTEDANISATTEPLQAEAVTSVSEPVTEAPKTGGKRKATESATANGDADQEVNATEAPAKKQKTSPIKNAINKVGAVVKKAGRPKKDQTEKKKEPAPIGKTARRTRSQAKTDEI